MYFVIVFILIMLIVWVNVVIQVMVVIVLTFRARIDSQNLNLSKRAKPTIFKRSYFYCRLKSKQLKYGKMQSCKDLFLTQQTCHSISLLTNQHFGHGHGGNFGHFVHVGNGGYLGQGDAKLKKGTKQNFWDLLFPQYTSHSISFLLNQHGGHLGHCSHSGNFGHGGHFVHVGSDG